MRALALLGWAFAFAGCLTNPAEPPAPVSETHILGLEPGAEDVLVHARLTALGDVRVAYGGAVMLPSWSTAEGCLLVAARPNIAELETDPDLGSVQDAWTTWDTGSIAIQGSSLHTPVPRDENVAGGSAARQWNLTQGQSVDVWLGGSAEVQGLGMGSVNVTSVGPVRWEVLPPTPLRCGVGLAQAQGSDLIVRSGAGQAVRGGSIAVTTEEATTMAFLPSTAAWDARCNAVIPWSAATHRPTRAVDGAARWHRPA